MEKEKSNSRGGLIHLFGARRGKIASFEIVTLQLGGMCLPMDIEITGNRPDAEISRYENQFINGERKRVLCERAVCSETEVLRLMNDCDLLSWDGFYGPHPKHLLDGTTFTLEAVVNDGRKIYAHGSANFPKHYRDFTDGLHAFFRKSAEEGCQESKK